jgi:MoaA/NifB/PqqE/SkfB family radical SAM enzyme
VAKSAELKVPIKFSPLNYVHSKEKDIKDLIPEPILYKEKLDYIKAEAKKNRYILNSKSNLRYLSSYPQGCQINQCVAARIFCHIKPNGSVYPCERVCTKLAPNSKREGIRKAFYSLSLTSCSECWCTATLELNLIYSFDMSALIKALGGGY